MLQQPSSSSAAPPGRTVLACALLLWGEMRGARTRDLDLTPRPTANAHERARELAHCHV